MQPGGPPRRHRPRNVDQSLGADRPVGRPGAPETAERGADVGGARGPALRGRLRRLRPSLRRRGRPRSRCPRSRTKSREPGQARIYRHLPETTPLGDQHDLEELQRDARCGGGACEPAEGPGVRVAGVLARRGGLRGGLRGGCLALGPSRTDPDVIHGDEADDELSGEDHRAGAAVVAMQGSPRDVEEGAVILPPGPQEGGLPRSPHRVRGGGRRPSAAGRVRNPIGCGRPEEARADPVEGGEGGPPGLGQRAHREAQSAVEVPEGTGGSVADGELQEQAEAVGPLDPAEEGSVPEGQGGAEGRPTVRRALAGAYCSWRRGGRPRRPRGRRGGRPRRPRGRRGGLGARGGVSCRGRHKAEKISPFIQAVYKTGSPGNEGSRFI